VISGRHRRRIVWLSSVLALVVAFPPFAAAASSPLRGKLDGSFGDHGRVFRGLGPTFASTSYAEILRQPDGSILLAGSTEAVQGKFNEPAGFVQRRLADGALDPGFPDVVLHRDVAGLALQPDGKVLFGSPHSNTCASTSTIRRLEPNGALDTSYGTNGVSATVPLAVSYMALDGAGRLVLAGHANVNPCGHDPAPDFRPALARLLPNGTLDKSFGKEGLALVTGPNSSVGEPDSFVGSVSGLAIQADGSIVIGGLHALFGLTEAGAVNGAFGSNGEAEVNGLLQALLQMPDGKLVAAGTSASYCCSQTGRFVVHRFLADGSSDPGFGDAGQVEIGVADVDSVTALAAASEGRLLLAGKTAVADGADGCGGTCSFSPFLTSLTATGAVDPGFAARLPEPALPPPGAFLSHYSSRIAALATTPAGQVLVAGGGEGLDQATLAELGPDGEPDPGFGSAGVVAEPTPLPSTTETGGLAIGPDGRIVVSARSNAGVYGSRSLLLGWNSDGSPLRGFGDGAGLAEVGSVGRLRVDGRGRLYQVYERYGSRHYVLRFDAAGHPDGSYGQAGMGLLPRGFQVESLIVRRDGAALLVGRIARRDPMALFELTPAGRPERRFGRDGLVTVGWGKGVKAGALSAAFDRRGRVVVFGYEGNHAAMARLLPNGRLDPSYAEAGRQPYMPGLFGAISSVSIAPDGRIYVAASPEESPFPGATTLIRFRGDGIRDRSFGHNGLVRVAAHSPMVGFFASARRLVLVSAIGGFGEVGVALRAFRTDGSRDRSFGRGGIVRGDPGKRIGFRPVAAARQPDGRIVVAGTRGTMEQSGARLELLRFR
jgi:uncharacterized delta-60 repeat protein